MNSLNRENTSSPSSFAEQLRRVRDAQQPDVARIPDLKQWMQYWNDEESEAHNLRNIQHWLSRVTQ
ncbi:MAG: hypothetical protein ABUS47_04245 [Steroidobacter sp.]